MNKREFTSKVCDVLRKGNARKPVAQTKSMFHISDDKGNQSDFVIKTPPREVIYTAKDVEIIFDACLEVVCDALKQGEAVNIHGFGKIGVHKRSARAAVHPGTGEPIDIAETYVPKLDCGNYLKRAAKIYAKSIAEKNAEVLPNINALDGSIID